MIFCRNKIVLLNRTKIEKEGKISLSSMKYHVPSTMHLDTYICMYINADPTFEE